VNGDELRAAVERNRGRRVCDEHARRIAQLLDVERDELSFAARETTKELERELVQRRSAVRERGSAVVRVLDPGRAAAYRSAWAATSALTGSVLFLGRHRELCGAVEVPVDRLTPNRLALLLGDAPDEFVLVSRDAVDGVLVDLAYHDVSEVQGIDDLVGAQTEAYEVTAWGACAAAILPPA